MAEWDLVQSNDAHAIKSVNVADNLDPMSHQILIVEDEPEIADLVKLHLADIHCDADIALDGETALQRFASKPHDLVILDLMLPDMDGLEVCRKLRAAQGQYVPILMLTSKNSELDRVLGLEMGADDYLTKPFSIPELLARVKALLRRAAAMTGSIEPVKTALKIGDLNIDTGKRKVTLADKEVDLTAKEFDLLVYFAKHPGQVFNRAQLLDQVWGYGHDGYEHTVNSHINRLRAKIEADPASPRYVLTVWGVGYRFAES